MDINAIGHSITIASCELWSRIVDKLANHMVKEFLQEADKQQQEAFVNKLIEEQREKLNERLTVIFNRVLTDVHFIKSFDQMVGPPSRSGDELKQDIERLNNQLQSVENESSTLQRDINNAIDKLETLTEEILENKLKK